MIDNKLEFSLKQTEGDTTLSSTGLEYPQMPNGMANLFNIKATLGLTLTALEASIGKLEFINTDEPGREITLTGMKKLYSGLLALFAGDPTAVVSKERPQR